MAKRKFDFSESDKVRVLLWCGRHCCLCGKQTGIGIEVAHIDRQSSDPDNAIPLCFECHATVGHYNREHPRGRKYSTTELKARRDQVYEEHTRHLIPPVHYVLRQIEPPNNDAPAFRRQLPDIGFHIYNLGNTYPVRARIKVTLAQGDHLLGVPQPQPGHYDGTYLWNLNPGFGVNGHFTAPAYNAVSSEQLRARVDVTLIDIYERPHILLPVGYVLEVGAGNEGNEWYLEPSEEILSVPVGT